MEAEEREEDTGNRFSFRRWQKAKELRGRRRKCEMIQNWPHRTFQTALARVFSKRFFIRSTFHYILRHRSLGTLFRHLQSAPFKSRGP